MFAYVLRVRWCAVCLVFLCVAGCSGTSRFRVDVSMDSAWLDGGTMPSVEVHMIGINDSEYATWSMMSMTEYWRESSRADKKNPRTYVMKFGEGKPVSQTLSKTDPIWQTWKANYSRYLFVLADIPGIYKDEAGDADARRLILPIDASSWRKVKYIPVSGSTIIVNITKPPSGVYCLNPPRSE